MTIKEGNGESKGSSRSTFKAMIRTNYSGYHLWAADYLAAQTLEIEQEYQGKSLEESIMYMHRAYVTNSLFSIVAFLEASINEFYQDTIDSQKRLSSLNKEVLSRLAEKWKSRKFRRNSSVLKKYQSAFLSANEGKFDEGQPPFENVAHLIVLRNSFVHYKPEFAGDEPYTDTVINKDLYSRLKGQFAVNPFTATGNPFFPDKCLSHGCAKWAVESSLEFADEFFRRLELKPPYDHWRSKLNLK